jgi:hypothetical protein
MPVVGDRVEVLPSKAGQLSRMGVVTGLSGSLISVRWDSGEETKFAPGPGAMRVVKSSPGRSTAARRRTSSPTRMTRTGATSKATAPRRSSQGQATSTPTRAASKKANAVKRSSTKKTAVAPKTPTADAPRLTTSKQVKKKDKKSKKKGRS